jgi:hypothetical protein
VTLVVKQVPVRYMSGAGSGALVSVIVRCATDK